MTETGNQDGQNLTLQGMTLANSFHILISIGMIAVSAYLTNYFFESHFPKGIGGPGSLCDLGQFWNCGGATFSKASNIAGVPISYFGIIIGVINIAGAIFPSLKMERTLTFIAGLNSIGCLGLFIFSILALGTLCPMCTVYYILSFASFFLFIKFGDRNLTPSIKHLAIMGVLTLIGAISMSRHYDKNQKQRSIIHRQIVDEFFKLKNYGDPDNESPYKLKSLEVPFAQAPIRITIFSDFECPFCSRISKQFEELEKQYSGEMAIQYLFFPLDSECNINVSRKMHAHACKAAYLAACSQEKFKVVHDYIFEHQKNISLKFLKETEKKFGLDGCLERKEVKDRVVNLIAESMKYNIRSTPTLIINGVKIEGSVPNDQMKAILDAILAKDQK